VIRKRTHGRIYDPVFQSEALAWKQSNVPRLSEEELHNSLLDLSTQHHIDSEMPDPTHPCRIDRKSEITEGAGATNFSGRTGQFINQKTKIFLCNGTWIV